MFWYYGAVISDTNTYVMKKVVLKIAASGMRPSSAVAKFGNANFCLGVGFLLC